MSRVRTVILLLVVANLVFFGWAHWIDVPAQAKAPSAAPVSIRITRDGDTWTTVASAPAPMTPTAAP